MPHYIYNQVLEHKFEICGLIVMLQYVTSFKSNPIYLLFIHENKEVIT